MECCLSKGELIRLDGGEGGLVLNCTAGTLWLTAGDGVDYLVECGSSFRLSAGLVAVAEALESSDFRLGGKGVHRPFHLIAEHIAVCR